MVISTWIQNPLPLPEGSTGLHMHRTETTSPNLIWKKFLKKSTRSCTRPIPRNILPCINTSRRKQMRSGCKNSFAEKEPFFQHNKTLILSSEQRTERDP